VLQEKKKKHITKINLLMINVDKNYEDVDGIYSIDMLIELIELC
jgi:hypothetical protein